MSFFLCNAAGLFVQMYPCILVLLLPFPPESFRFPRRRVFWVMTGYALLAAVVFPTALAGIAPIIGAWYLVGNALYLLAMVLVVVLFLWMVRDAAKKKILAMLIAAFYAAAQFWLVNLVLPFVPFGAAGRVYSPRGLFLYIVSAALLLPVVLMLVARPLGNFIREIAPGELTRSFWFTVLVTAGYIAMMVYFDSVNGGYSREKAVLFGPLFLLVLLQQCLVYWLLYREVVQNKRNAETQRTMEIQRIQSEKITGEIEGTRRMRHDMRHHLNVLHQMLRRNKSEEALAYLNDLIDDTVRQDDTVYCQNDTVNALLQFYGEMARSEQISCRIQAACGELSIVPADLTVLLGNAMENAIRSCRQIPAASERWIRVQIGVVHGSLVMEIRNACRRVSLARRYQREPGFLPAEAFLSDRSDGGFGLRSMAYTAAKYGGEALFHFDGAARTFTVRIRLNLHAEIT